MRFPRAFPILLSIWAFAAAGNITAQAPGPSPSSPQTSGKYQVSTSDETTPSPPSAAILDLNSLPAAVRQQLLPLYQQESALLQQLARVRLQALGETLQGLAAIGAAASGGSTSAGSVAEETAARAGQPGAGFYGTNAALDAQTPAEISENVDLAVALLGKIGALERAISTVQAANGIDPTKRSPWSALPKSKQLTPGEVTKLLRPCFTSAMACYGSCKLNTAPLTGGAVAIIDSSRNNAAPYIRCMNACATASPTNEVCPTKTK